MPLKSRPRGYPRPSPEDWSRWKETFMGNVKLVPLLNKVSVPDVIKLLRSCLWAPGQSNFDARWPLQWTKHWATWTEQLNIRSFSNRNALRLKLFGYMWTWTDRCSSTPLNLTRIVAYTFFGGWEGGDVWQCPDKSPRRWLKGRIYWKKWYINAWNWWNTTLQHTRANAQLPLNSGGRQLPYTAGDYSSIA